MAADVMGYLKAATDSRFAQEFLSAMELPEGASRIVYDPDNERLLAYLAQLSRDGSLTEPDLSSLIKDITETRAPSFQTYLPRSLLGKGLSSPIFVSDGAFIDYDSFQVFKSALEDHEGQHTKDARDGILLGDLLLDYSTIRYISERTEAGIFEVRAYMNQLKRAYSHGLRYTKYFKAMWNEFLEFSFYFSDPSCQPMSDIEKCAVDLTVASCNAFKRAYAAHD
ncbi:MAG: hypothetical protein HGA85_05280 [Nanoarchaeota archaeon]|nr:hypothetical protein [Nanoarchaeota archaeon]